MIEGIRADDPVFGQSDAGPQELDKNAFLQLLIAQMKNQSPLDPTSNDEFIAQLAQFSSLEQMQVVNENLVGLAVLQQSNALMSQLTDSSALIGKSVRYDDPETGEPKEGTVASVKLEEGLAILRIDGKDIPLANVTEVTGEQGGDDGSEENGAS